VSWACDEPAIAAALREHADAIAKEILAVEFREGAVNGATAVDVNKVKVNYTIAKRE
jgi:hypothetical protein